MVNLTLYKTLSDYPNETGINQIAYPLRDSIIIANPFFIILMGLFFVLTVASYYSFVAWTGKERYFNSILASSFVTTIISMFFSLQGLINPYGVLTFIAITIISLALVIFYRR